MKYILLILIMGCACPQNKNTVHTVETKNTYGTYEILQVDTMFHVGDTFPSSWDNSTDYRIITKE